MKKILSAALLLALLLCLGSSALADSSVSYEGGAEKFVFLPGSEYSDSDLFENFKNVLPGDELTQDVTVVNHTEGEVRIYMRAEPVDEADVAFLSQLWLTVESSDETIFEAAASETAQLTENTLLGTFKKDGSTDLLVTLTVPTDMGNEFMGAVGVVPWTFIVEEIPDDDSPHTGDWFRSGLWMAIAAVLLAVIVLLVVIQYKRRVKN